MGRFFSRTRTTSLRPSRARTTTHEPAVAGPLAPVTGKPNGPSPRFDSTYYTTVVNPDANFVARLKDDTANKVLAILRMNIGGAHLTARDLPASEKVETSFGRLTTPRMQPGRWHQIIEYHIGAAQSVGIIGYTLHARHTVIDQLRFIVGPNTLAEIATAEAASLRLAVDEQGDPLVCAYLNVPLLFQPCESIRIAVFSQYGGEPEQLSILGIQAEHTGRTVCSRRLFATVQ